MRISYEWLSDYVDTNGLSPQEAAEILTMSGTKIESVQVLDLSAIIVGRVLEQKDHPSSNKPLWIHQVDVGAGKVIQIIAGAPNAVAGTLVPVALPGTRVPSGTLVRDAKIAGQLGQGMLCSADELLLGEDREPRIMLLDRGEPGESLAKYIPPDAILEAEITPNRPDCLGHIGVARELGAAAGRDFKANFMPPYIEGVQPPAAELIDIAIEVPDLCSRFVAVPITGVKVAPSPDWVQRRLRAAGVRPISNVVDATALRHEKGLAPEMAMAAARRAAALVRDWAGGQVHADWVDVYPRPQEPVRIVFPAAKIDALLGVEVHPQDIQQQILPRLGFQVGYGGQEGFYEILPPVFRLDVELPEDVIEEVGRIYGIDRIPATLPGSRRHTWEVMSPDDHHGSLREVVLGAGFDEVVSPALVPRRLLQRLGLAEGARTLFNPMSDELDTMRTSLLPSLLSVARYNQNRTAERVDVFELARVYRGKRPDGLADEQVRLTVLARVDAGADAGRRGFLRLKSVMDRLAQDLAAGTVRYLRASPDLYHPGRAASIMVGGSEIGVVGELHPSTLAVFDLDGRAVALDVNAEALIAARGDRKAAELPRYPSVQRDIAVVVDPNVPAGDLHRAIKEAGGGSLESVRAFDEYRGDQAGEGRKSIAFTLTFRSPERTLTDAEVEKVMSEIRKRLEKKHGARIRT